MIFKDAGFKPDEDNGVITTRVKVTIGEPGTVDTEESTLRDPNTFKKYTYGWSVELPDGWSCVYEDMDSSYGVYGNTVFESTDNIGEEGFNIYAVELGSEHDDKEKGVYSSAPDCGYLGEDSHYAYYWSICGMSAVTPELQTPDLCQKVRAIAATFKLD